MSAQALAPGASRAAIAPRRRRTPSAWTITAFCAVIYLIAAPPSPDLAAAAYRGDLFSRVGFTLWDNSWFAGHHLPAYSLLAPALSALLGPQLLVALSMTAAAAMFAALIDGRFPARAVTLAAAWFAVGASVELLSSRVPYDLGLAVGLGSLLLAQRGRWALALALAVLCALASPVAGAFLALAYLAWTGAGASRRRTGACLLGALLPIALLALAFPEGGSQPFVPSAFFPALAAVALIWLLIPSEQAILKLGTLLYAFVLLGAYLLPTAVGGNADRLGALLAGPLAACVLVGSGRGPGRARLLLVLAPVLLYWQANAAVTDYVAAVSDPSVHASYYAPLLGELRALDVGYSRRPARIEVVPLADHWEARWVAPQVMIARGWERQLDRRRDALFYDPSAPLDVDLSPPLTAARFHTWLAEQAVSYVALPDARLDYAARAEARLIRSGRLAFLREVWHSRHWRLFAVRDTSPLAAAPATITSASTDSFTISAPRAGSYMVRIHFTPYWAVSGGPGCVARAPGDWTDVEARRAGRLRIVIHFSLARVLSRGPRCN